MVIEFVKGSLHWLRLAQLRWRAPQRAAIQCQLSENA